MIERKERLSFLFKWKKLFSVETFLTKINATHLSTKINEGIQTGKINHPLETKRHIEYGKNKKLIERGSSIKLNAPNFFKYLRT